MNVGYELIDTDDGNLVGSYAIEVEAEQVVQSAYALDGSHGVRSLALIRVDHATGAQELVADGSEFVRRVSILISDASARSAG